MLELPNELFCSIGQIVIYWAMIEWRMHDCLFLIYHKCGGNKLISRKELPYSLSSMIKFWD